jgi:hypothetical protein
VSTGEQEEKPGFGYLGSVGHGKGFGLYSSCSEKILEALNRAVLCSS